MISSTYEGFCLKMNLSIRRFVAATYSKWIKSALQNNPSFFDLWYGQALNGQYARLFFLFDMIKVIRPKIIIETGTYLGSSTILFAYLFDKVFTIESNSKYFDVAKKRFSLLNLSNITCISGKSQSVLKDILESIPSNSEDILFAYLDAHWEEQVPTTCEINQLLDWGGAFIALIDDFKIEHDSGYFFDRYASIIIGNSIVPKSKDLRLFVLKIISSQESGARRGLGIVINSAAINLIDHSFFDTVKEISL
jgi:cephalosporin hydroxylase